jgi:folylpolyglutamate synthase/dihydropteroate synthase
MTQKLEKCRKIQEIWNELKEENVKNKANSFNVLQPAYITNNVPKSLLHSFNSIKSKSEVKLFPCVSETLAYLKRKNRDEGHEFHILVTGSLHLIGSILSVLDPALSLAASQLSDGNGVSAINSTDVAESYSS